MKKKLLIVLIVIFSSCGVVQQEMIDKANLNKELKTYSLQIPDTWYSFREVHGHIMHSPKVMKKRSDNFYENNFYVTEYPRTFCNSKNIDELLEFYHRKLKRHHSKITFHPKKLHHKKYGEYYLFKYTTSWSKVKIFTNIDIIFNYKNRNFVLQYTIESKYFEEFRVDLRSIIRSFKIQ